MAKGAVLEFDGDAPDADEILADIACDAVKGNERTQPYKLVWIFLQPFFHERRRISRWLAACGAKRMA